MRSAVLKFVLLVLCAFALVVDGPGQQTIFNVPSADVMDKGKVYGELDVSFKTNCQEALCRFSSFVPRVVVGAVKNVEVGLNITGNVQPGADTTTIVPTVKWRFYHDEKTHVDMYGGNDLYIPIRNKTYDLGTYTYVAVAKTIKKTRLTAGGYIASKGVFAPRATRGGGQFGFEQAITKNFNVIADWITGQHSAGYFTPGVSFKPGAKWTGYAGYSIGNANAVSGNHFFLMELGYNFN